MFNRNYTEDCINLRATNVYSLIHLLVKTQPHKLTTKPALPAIPATLVMQLWIKDMAITNKLDH